MTSNKDEYFFRAIHHLQISGLLYQKKKQQQRWTYWDNLGWSSCLNSTKWTKLKYQCQTQALLQRGQNGKQKTTTRKQNNTHSNWAVIRNSSLVYRFSGHQNFLLPWINTWSLLAPFSIWLKLLDCISFLSSRMFP